MTIITRNTALAAALSCLWLPAASAHVTLEQPTAQPGASYKAVLRIPHGCEGEATHTLRVRIPEGFYDVKPMPKAGWMLETLTGDYARAYDNHGTAVTRGVTEIIWSGGKLPDDFYDEFVFRGRFADSLPADSRFYFPTVQECANGVARWIDTSGGEESDEPAPGLTLKAGHHH
ncbi:YcnI family copper-binding membrane protein [Zobellella denitrificans]